MMGMILVVDHDLANRGFLRECLEGQGHQVLALPTSVEINECLASKKVDAIILNLDTPGVRNRTFLAEIGKKTRARVLLTVSERGDIFLKEAMELGVYGFLYRPFDPDEVCTMISHLVRPS